MINMERARGLVARCWQDPRTSATVMDPALAEVFAESLVKLVNSAEALYMAGRWILEDERIQTTDQKQAKLWEDLRSALGLASGHSTEAGVNSCPGFIAKAPGLGEDRPGGDR